MSENVNAAAAAKKKGIIEVFMAGCRKGIYIALEQIMPAMILGYVIVQFLQLTGIINILAKVGGPVMGIFGLPGETITVFVSAFFAKAAGAATAANLYTAGVLTAAQATMCVIPSMLMGTLVGHYARNVLVADVEPKYRGLLLAVPIIDTIIGLFLMRIILSVMGLM